jgi:hypothetical protein
MTIIKFLNGDVMQYDEKDEERLVDLIAGDLNLDRVLVGLIKNDQEKEEDVDYVDFFVLIDDTPKILYILNMTEGNFFSYEKKKCFDKGYMKVVKSLMKENVDGFSHWNREDKIIFVPDHLRDYVSKSYGKLNV